MSEWKSKALDVLQEVRKRIEAAEEPRVLIVLVMKEGDLLGGTGGLDTFGNYSLPQSHHMLKIAATGTAHWAEEKKGYLQ